MKKFEPMPTVVGGYRLPEVDTRPQHIQDFDVVAKYYKCSNKEIDEMRELANKDREDSIRFYYDVAKQIRFWQRCEDALPMSLSSPNHNSCRGIA